MASCFLVYSDVLTVWLHVFLYIKRVTLTCGVISRVRLIEVNNGGPYISMDFNICDNIMMVCAIETQPTLRFSNNLMRLFLFLAYFVYIDPLPHNYLW